MSAPAILVLVIDDEPPIRKLLRMGLGTQGYQVIDAPNGKAALERLADKPDLIILDLGLPDMPGLELLRRLRERGITVPIIVLSSRGDEAGKVQALDLGADDYVTKPFGMNELLARMRAAQRHQIQSKGERPLFRIGDLTVDLVRRVVTVRDQEVKLSPEGVRALAGVRPARREGSDPPVSAAGGLGGCDGCAVPAGLCPAAAPEDRARSRAAALSPDRNRGGLSPA